MEECQATKPAKGGPVFHIVMGYGPRDEAWESNWGVRIVTSLPDHGEAVKKMDELYEELVAREDPEWKYLWVSIVVDGDPEHLKALELASRG